MSRNRLVKSYGTKEVNTIVPYVTTARNAVNDVGGGASKIVPNNEIGFRSGNRCGRVEERTRVTTSKRYPLVPIDFV